MAHHPSTVFADVPRRALLSAMVESVARHRVHEKASLYSVLDACRAWRYADEGVLGSKLAGADWARARWADTKVIDAAVALRHGHDAELDSAAVDRLLSSVGSRLQESV